MVTTPLQPSPRSSLKSSTTSLRSIGTQSDRMGPSELKHKPTKTWSIWGSNDQEGPGSSSNKKDRKEQHNDDIQETAFVVNESNNLHDNQQTKILKETSKIEKGENAKNSDIGTKAENTARTRMWPFFWGRSKKDPEPTHNIPANADNNTLSSLANSLNPAPLTNTYIPYKPDAILIKDKNVTTTKKLTDDVGNQFPNIVVPSFDILPKRTIWNTFTSTILKLKTEYWDSRPPSRIREEEGAQDPQNQIKEGTNAGVNVEKNEEPLEHNRETLYRVDPWKKINLLSDYQSRPIRVLLVGVHGFFPTKIIRPFIGEPTGTSTKFVTEAEEIVKEYFDQYKVPIEINKIALEREGEIFDRVDFFYEVMKHWSKEINNSDFIYFVSHSQGCPVTIMLLAKLIKNGVINLDNSQFFNDEIQFCSSKKIISILAMAGINNGPFYGADQTLFVRAYQTIEKDSLRELFEFQKFDSKQSQSLIEGLRTVISNNVKITFVGSINDQLVPLYSSTCLFVNHPNIFRAIFIDRGSQTPAFITRIVKIAGSLLDLGYNDHGIIKEISGSLAGTLTGGGHSSIYNEKQVYHLGIKFALETTDLSEIFPVEYSPYKLSELGANPYRLPWCMRGLMYESNKHFSNEEIKMLFKEFEEWEPETKQLKDIKNRLNGLKYRL
ncbi:YML020W [Saccharomyces arboricola H-6]|uniref:YML020W n=1 Tax=Saccharomyces arboricola (strain H-6 / AS 2.3317 / CBS 10644) TaxID=1160507 RepID=J8PYL1_SACAR|nr:YML020W [Saccharomyces arboricola H-6]